MAKHRRNKQVISWGFFGWLLAFYTLGLAAFVVRYSPDANSTARRTIVHGAMQVADMAPDSLRDEIARGSFIASNTVRDWQAR